MSTKKHPFVIKAQSVEDFQRVELVVAKWPQSIIDQIAEVQSGHFDITCTFKEAYHEAKINLPNDTSQITDFGDYIGVYTPKCFFRIPFKPENKAKLNITYLFVEYPEVKK